MAQQTKLEPSIVNQVRRFADQVKNAKIPVDRFIVFGSYAKGNPNVWSDIDVCVVSPHFGRNAFDELVRLSKLTDDTTIDIEPHPMHPRDLESKYDTLAAEIRKYGIEVKV